MSKAMGRCLRIGLCMIILCGCFSILSSVQNTGSAQGDIEWRLQTVDIEGDVGKFTSLAFGTGPAISYYDVTNRDLKLAWDKNNDGDFSDDGEVVPVDILGRLGLYTSLAFDTSGRVAISYYDSDGNKLRFAYDRNGDGVIGSGEIVVIDEDEATVGTYTSLAFGAGPAISYYDAFHSDLKFAYDRNNDGNFAPVEIITADDTGFVGEYTSLAFDGLGRPAISYYDWFNGDLKLAQDKNNDGDFSDAGEIITVDDGGLQEASVGQYTSLAFDDSWRVAISYYDTTNSVLKLAYDRNNDGDFDDTNEISIVDSVGDVGKFTSLDFGSGPAISYYDESNKNLKLAWDMDNDGDFDSGEKSIVDSVGDVGEYTSLDFDSSGRLAISYYNATSGNLKLASDSPPVQPTPTPTPIPTLTPTPTPTTHTWDFFKEGFFPKHLPDSYTETVDLDSLTDVPPQVQGVYYEDGTFWGPGAPGTTLKAMGGGHSYDYMVTVSDPCKWVIQLQ